ncbi:kinesin-related protein 10-like isoform X2 [Sitodiplosis mosellana]|uniref:kinesin-related protein 10-like isoform X2 n=1 Tax=Sitodiplosis mosellana TaxID=263140 RepID=UPI002443C63C|nr:kinesin-related protein 10-like isoform X2 [Sitodiplosis mosellana]
MVSRRKILSRSRDDLSVEQPYVPEEEEDVWYQKDKLFKEHIQEVLDKWDQIDDEIWAKLIVFEGNRRVAKAYARAPILTINNSDDGFDGMRIGLCGFENPMRSPKTDELKRQIGQGVKIKMDDAGNILIRRYSRSNVYIKSTASSSKDETAIGNEILKLPNQALEIEKISKLFDVKKFQSNISRELKQAYPDRRRLELQCLSAISFVRTETDVLDCPIWVLILNVVAMDMLKSKMPPMQRPVNVKSRPRLPIPDDEDPYSIAGNNCISNENSDSSGYSGSSNSNGHSSVASTQRERDQKFYMVNTSQQQSKPKRSSSGSSNGSNDQNPPQLPPRDTSIYSHELPMPDYDDDVENGTHQNNNNNNNNINNTINSNHNNNSSKLKLFFRSKSKESERKKHVIEDPYYCGLSARVPKFDRITPLKKSNKNQNVIVPKRMSVAYLQHPMIFTPTTGTSTGNGYPAQHPIKPQQFTKQKQCLMPRRNYQQMMWHARSMESGLEIDLLK